MSAVVPLTAPEIALLLPDAYARFAPLIADGLAYFLERLPGHRRDSILSTLCDGASRSSIIARLMRLLHQCPTLHKLGQVLCRHRSLPHDLRQALQTLESLEGTASREEFQPLIEAELGDGLWREIALGDRAIAEGSVAIVVPFTWHADRGSEHRAGVFKVLKPGIERTVEEDLDAWGDLASFLEDRSSIYGLPLLPYRETLVDVRDLIAREVHLSIEQAHMIEASELYASHPDVMIPRLFPYCTARLTAMERVWGVKVTEEKGDSPGSRRRVADAILDALLLFPMWSMREVPLFHADPHAGNLLVCADLGSHDRHRIALLDWSLACRLTRYWRDALTRIVIAGVTLNPMLAHLSLTRLGEVRDVDGLESAVGHSFSDLSNGAVPGIRWLISLLDRAARNGAVKFPADLLMFRKAILTIQGVIGDIASDCSVDAAVFVGAMRQLSLEWPRRLFAGPWDVDFGTMMSNFDLASLAMQASLNPVKFLANEWRGWAQGLLQPRT